MQKIKSLLQLFIEVNQNSFIIIYYYICINNNSNFLITIEFIYK